jgi:hypothetical protein
MSRPWILANALALAVVVACLAALVLPTQAAVRARNAFLLRRGRSGDFEWTPETAPPDFRIERDDAPGAIAEAARASGAAEVTDDWHRALALVGMLISGQANEGAIHADLVTTFHGIRAGRGYCADYVRVYMAAARTAGLFCRQWAFSFDGFGGHGHTFVEVYDRQRAAWAFIDVQNNVYAVYAGDDAPLAALALREALLASPSRIEFRRAAPGRLGFPHPEKLLDYYRRGAAEWYLWWGNDVITRERSGVPGILGALSGRLAHRISALGGLPPFKVLATPDNESAIERMERLCRWATALGLIGLGLGLALALQWGWPLIAHRFG